MDKIICLCEDSVDGIFTAIHKAWELGTSRTMIEVRGIRNISLFSEYIEIETDTYLANKVAESVRRKISPEVYYYIYRSALSDNDDKAQFIYEFLQKAFKIGPGIVNHLQDDNVMKVFEMTRRVGNEAHRYLGFVRFVELKNEVLVSKIDPHANIVPLIADHFADRLHTENWIILDTKRDFAAVHRAGKGHVFTSNISEADLDGFSAKSENEEKFNSLWERFFDTIAIEERKNDKLQKQMMPLRYRKYM